MSENLQSEPDSDESTPTPAEVTENSAGRSEADQVRYDHDDQMVDEWEDESFPASDPPGHY